MNIVTATADWFEKQSSGGMPPPSALNAVIGREYTNAYSASVLHVVPNTRFYVSASASGRALFMIQGAGLIVAADSTYQIEQGSIAKLARYVECTLINHSPIPFEVLVIQDGPVAPGKLNADAIKSARESLEIVNSGALDWLPFLAQGVAGYELKPSIVGSEHTAAYSIDMLRVAPKGYSSAHTDQGRHAFFILGGRGSIDVDGERFDFERGDIVKVPPESVHELQQLSSEPLVFLAIYDPPRSRK